MITNTRLAWGDHMGAQMTTYANLIYLAKENHHDIVLFQDLRYFRRKYQFLDVFRNENFTLLDKPRIPAIELYNRQFKKKKDWKADNKRMYNAKLQGRIDWMIERLFSQRLGYVQYRKLQNGVSFDPALSNLPNDKSYNIQSGFAVCRVWDKYREDIVKTFAFKDEVKEAGDKLWESLGLQGKETVSVHFRLTDYLVLSSLNLSADYYKQALEHFTGDETFVVFSDDIAAVKAMNLFAGRNVVYVEGQSAGVDMYLMSRCSHNIAANSSFSFWGAYLNTNPVKKVVCPREYIGASSPANLYMNGNWYPTDWIAIQT